MKFKTGFIVLLALLATAAGAFAQTVGSIEGTVTDNSSGALPGATVEVTNDETGITRTVVTDAEGRYRARDLSLGQYRLQATLPGFQTSIRQGVVLTIGREAVVNFELQIGGVSEELIVTGDAPLIETTNSGMTSLVAREQMEDLPLNARDFSQLISLQGGTTQYRNTGAPGAVISISGARPNSSVFTLDGSDVKTAEGLLPSGVSGAMLGLEAIQEFKILTSTYSAQYGRSAGGTVVAATRSGTNELHGTAYWYIRNDLFDARNFFDVGEKPEFNRNQFGASTGAPIVRNRTFVFVNFEALRERLPSPLSASVPTAAARQGILPTGTVTVPSEPTGRFLTLWPMPNGKDFGDGTAEYTSSGARVTDQTYTSLRLDHNFSSNSSVFGRYTYEVSDQIAPMSIPLVEDKSASKNQYVTIEQKQVLSPRMFNQVRLTFTRTNVGSQTLETPLTPDESFSVYEGRPFGNINVSGLTGLSGGVTPYFSIVNMGQVQDDATIDTGRHSLHFGGGYTFFQFNKLQLSRAGGDWEFGSLADFLQNRPPTRLRIMGFNADPYRTNGQKMLTFYAQDDIKFGANLTLNAGVRYEYLTAPTERHGRIATLHDISDTVSTVGDPFYENPGGFFSPRLGLVWDPTGKGTTSVRTGIGVFHEPLLMQHYHNAVDRLPPFWSDVDPVPANLGGLFADLNPHLERLSKGEQAVHVFQFEPDNPYSIQTSLAIQHQLKSDLVAEIAYTGMHGLHLAGRKEYAVPTPTFINGDTFYETTATLYNPAFSRFSYYDTSAASWYHGLKTMITKRYASGLHFQGAYTFSKATDELSSSLSGQLGSTSVMDPFDPKRDWALADFHVAHTFSASFSYLLPWGKDLQGVAAALGRGWQVSGIFIATSGTPFTVQSNATITHSLNRGSARPDLIPDGDNNPILGGPTLYFDPTQFAVQPRGFYGNAGRNTLIGPGLNKLDLSVIKTVPLGASRNIQLRVECFNVLNEANFGLPARSLFNNRGARVGTAGRITNTITTARQMQLAARFAF